MRWNVRAVIVVIAGLLRQVWSRMILGLVVAATDATIPAMRAIDAHARILPAVLGIAPAAVLLLLLLLLLLFLECFTVGGIVAINIGRWCCCCRRNSNSSTGT